MKVTVKVKIVLSKIVNLKFALLSLMALLSSLSWAQVQVDARAERYKTAHNAELSTTHVHIGGHEVSYLPAFKSISNISHDDVLSHSFPRYTWSRLNKSNLNSLRWQVSLEQDTQFHIFAHVLADEQTAFKLHIENSPFTLTSQTVNKGWQRIDMGSLDLSSGDHLIVLESMIENSHLEVKSIELRATNNSTANFDSGAVLQLNNDDSQLIYHGKWHYADNRQIGDYQSDLHYSKNIGSSFEYEFWGRGIRYFAPASAQASLVEIFIDGVSQGDHKIQANTYQAQQMVFQIAELDLGQHQLTVIYKAGDYIALDKLQVIAAKKNVALGKATQHSTTRLGGESSFVVDGHRRENMSSQDRQHASLLNEDEHAWWQVDLGEVYDINQLAIYSLTCCQQNNFDYYIFSSKTPFSSYSLVETLSQDNVKSRLVSGGLTEVSRIVLNADMRYIRIQLKQQNQGLFLAEFEAYSHNDSDDDEFNNELDNCPFITNAQQDDFDGDGRGDECDDDKDNDGISNDADACINTSLMAKVDEQGCALSGDEDNDGINDDIDNCLFVANQGQWDKDQDDIGNECDDDIDGDQYSNEVELAAGTNMWDPRYYPGKPKEDSDSDGISNLFDNCPYLANVDQADHDTDGSGNVCDEDIDGDGFSNSKESSAGTKIWNALSFPSGLDTDGDSVLDVFDNCIFISNVKQWDRDSDQIGDDCDDDLDGDGASNEEETKAGTSISDKTSFPAKSDQDGDGVVDAIDNCKNIANSGQWDKDGDGLGNACDNDLDGDGFDDVEEVKAGTRAWDASSFPLDVDSDGDGYLDSEDNCLTVPNPSQGDQDQDQIGNECDLDIDGDGYTNIDEINAGTKVWRADSYPQ